MAIFDIKNMFLNCPPPSNSMRCFLLCACIFGESVRHLSFCENRDFYGGDSEKEWDMFFVGVNERKEIYILQKNLLKIKKIIIGI